MALFQSIPVCNRLLNMLAPDDFAQIEPMLECVSLEFSACVIAARQAIAYVYFPESGIVSTVANTDEGRIEIGITGNEGFVGIPVILGVDSTPHTSFVQAVGQALRIATLDLRAAIVARPGIHRPLGLYAHAMMVQLAQTAYANVAFTVEARLARWILMTQDRMGSDNLVMTHEFLSVMLGVRRPGVTVALHALKAMQAIETTRGRVTVQNRDMLKDIAGDAYQLAEVEYERVMALEKS